MTTCDKCGTEKIVVEQAVTGFPDHHVAGTRQEYCGYCDEPPIVELSVTGRGAMVLTPNDKGNGPRQAQLAEGPR